MSGFVRTKGTDYNYSEMPTMGCGITDAWRRAQGLPTRADRFKLGSGVGYDEFNYSEMPIGPSFMDLACGDPPDDPKRWGPPNYWHSANMSGLIEGEDTMMYRILSKAEGGNEEAKAAIGKIGRAALAGDYKSKFRACLLEKLYARWTDGKSLWKGLGMEDAIMGFDIASLFQTFGQGTQKEIAEGQDPTSERYKKTQRDIKKGMWSADNMPQFDMLSKLLGGSAGKKVTPEAYSTAHTMLSPDGKYEDCIKLLVQAANRGNRIAMSGLVVLANAAERQKQHGKLCGKYRFLCTETYGKPKVRPFRLLASNYRRGL